MACASASVINLTACPPQSGPALVDNANWNGEQTDSTVFQLSGQSLRDQFSETCSCCNTANPTICTIVADRNALHTDYGISARAASAAAEQQLQNFQVVQTDSQHLVCTPSCSTRSTGQTLTEQICIESENSGWISLTSGLFSCNSFNVSAVFGARAALVVKSCLVPHGSCPTSTCIFLVWYYGRTGTRL